MVSSADRRPCGTGALLDSPAMSAESATAASPVPTRGKRERVFSGVQPSGLPHVGNYLGAFRNYIAMQETHDAIYCIVDYHALTSTHDAELIRRNTYEMALGPARPGPRPRALDPLPPVGSPRTRRAHLAAGLGHAGQLGRADAVVQGEEADPAGRRQPRPADLSHPADGRHRHLPREVRAGRQGPGRASRAGPRDRACVERPLWRLLRRAAGRLHRLAHRQGHRRRATRCRSRWATSSRSSRNPTEVRKQVMSMVTDTQRIKRTDPGRPEVCNVCQLQRFFGDDYEALWEGERTAAHRLRRHEAPAGRPHDRALRRGPRAPGRAGGAPGLRRRGPARRRRRGWRRRRRDTLREAHERMGLGPVD